jgi:hypothetical protein
MFVYSLAKTFGHLSDRAKKIQIDKALTLEHYTRNRVFVSPRRYPTKARLIGAGLVISNVSGHCGEPKPIDSSYSAR